MLRAHTSNYTSYIITHYDIFINLKKKICIKICKYAFLFANLLKHLAWLSHSVNTHNNLGDFMTVIIIRTLLVYAIVTAAVRIMGKRQVSDMQTSELVITLIISEVASLPLENTDRPLLVSLVPILMIAAIEILVSLLMLKSKRARGIICGHPIVIIKDGQLIESEMRRLRISYEDVYSLLRQQNCSDPATVKYGVIEPNGSLSILEEKNLSNDGVRSAELQEELDRLQENEDNTKDSESSGQEPNNNQKKGAD